MVVNVIDSAPLSLPLYVQLVTVDATIVLVSRTWRDHAIVLEVTPAAVRPVGRVTFIVCPEVHLKMSKR